jgi:SAM-dependent methyltransferase
LASRIGGAAWAILGAPSRTARMDRRVWSSSAASPLRAARLSGSTDPRSKSPRDLNGNGIVNGSDLPIPPADWDRLHRTSLRRSVRFRAMTDHTPDDTLDPELELLVDLHLGHERQGPGSSETTRRAIDLAGLRPNPDRPLRIADLGCGTGASALVLAETLAKDPSESPGAEIVAIDGIGAFIERLRERVADRGLSGRLEGRVADMAALPLGDGEFDVLWSEGAIYNIGFEHGARIWRRHLRPGGLLAVTELSWTSADRPAEIERHWQTAYPGIATPSENLARLERVGYLPIGFFMLPASCWSNYHDPIEASLPAFLERHADGPHRETARAVAEGVRVEIDLRRRYGAFFGYAFHLARTSTE